MHSIQQWLRIDDDLAFRDGDPAAEAILIKLLNDPDPLTRGRAAVRLPTTHPVKRAVIDALARALADDSAEVRWAAALSLSGIGKEGQSAVPSLVQALHDPDYAVRREAAEALCEVAPQAAEAAGVK